MKQFIDYFLSVVMETSPSLLEGMPSLQHSTGVQPHILAAAGKSEVRGWGIGEGRGREREGGGDRGRGRGRGEREEEKSLGSGLGQERLERVECCCLSL